MKFLCTISILLIAVRSFAPHVNGFSTVANVTASGSGMVVTDLGTANLINDLSTYSTASAFTPTAARLVLAMVINTKAANADTPTMSGNNLTWVMVTNVTYAGATSRLSVFRALGGSPSNGNASADFAGQTQTSCVIKVLEVSNTDSTGSNGSGAIVQFVAASGSSSANPSLNIPAISGGGLNAVFAFSGNSLGTYAGTAENGWTEFYDSGHALPNQGSYICYDIDTTDNTIAITASSANWGLVAVEVKSQ